MRNSEEQGIHAAAKPPQNGGGRVFLDATVEHLHLERQMMMEKGRDEEGRSAYYDWCVSEYALPFPWTGFDDTGGQDSNMLGFNEHDSC